MPTSKKPTVAQFHMVGDKVMWKGIKLTIVQIKDDGSLVATSPTMRVHVSSGDQLEKHNG
jgi:hypothetical protein